MHDYGKLSLKERLRILFTGKVPHLPKQISNLEEEAENTQQHESAAQLLQLLQKHGRLVDFIFEDIDTYSDEQVGAGVRVVHQGCRKVLND